MPLVVTVIVVVVVATTIADLPAAMPASAAVTVQDGAAAHVPLKVTTQPDAGTPVAPIVTVPHVSVPTTDGDVPQFDEQVGGVPCAPRNCMATLVPVAVNFTAPAAPRESEVSADPTPLLPQKSDEVLDRDRPAELRRTTSLAAIDARRSPDPARYQPEFVSVANAILGADAVPSPTEIVERKGVSHRATAYPLAAVTTAVPLVHAVARALTPNSPELLKLNWPVPVVVVAEDPSDSLVPLSVNHVLLSEVPSKVSVPTKVPDTANVTLAMVPLASENAAQEFATAVQALPELFAVTLPTSRTCAAVGICHTSSATSKMDSFLIVFIVLRCS